ncbi:sensor histidine kinase [Nonomuraea typhae]|uniref:sensor histidine kinase n=1 Tax=Nonomuraea typhae TaxID=2603600 RepID=UPI0015E23BE5|nr:sensor histidine kinase [Nonomuraea typhae]
MRRIWAEFRYAVTALPIALAGLTGVGVLLVPGLTLAVVFAGLPLLAAAVSLAGWFADIERRRQAALLSVRIGAPAGPGGARWLSGRLKHAAGWRAVAFTLLKPLTALLPFSAVLLFWAAGAVELAYPLWRHVGGLTQVWGGLLLDTWPRSLLATGAGALLLACAPWAVRGAILLDRLPAGALLSPAKGAERLRHLERTRTQAVDDAAATLRRIERDLHDGAQARMVAVTMDLITAGRLLEDATQLDRARELLDLARHNAGAAVGELRDLAKGIHPPALDHGLDTALATLAAARGGIPVEVSVDLPERPGRASESILYFCAAELLANVFKHSHATRAVIEVRGTPSALMLRVHDDGYGGAALTSGGGLDGLAARLRPVDGRLTLTSPPGGPTTVVVELPHRR